MGEMVSSFAHDETNKSLISKIYKQLNKNKPIKKRTDGQ